MKNFVMNVRLVFLQKIYQTLSKKYFSIFFVVIIFSVYGCGGDSGVGERLSGPATNSALPIRIDATVTPTVTATPETEDASQENQELSLTASEQATTTPTPEQTQETTVFATETPNQQKEIASDPSPTPSPLPSSYQESTANTSETPDSEESDISDSDGDSESTEDESEEEDPSTSQETAQEQSVQQASSKSKSKQTTSSQNITLDRAVVCSKISNRNPSDIADEFSLSKVGRVYVWMRVSGVTPPDVVKHIYYREGKLIATVKLKLKYSSMRTWSQKTFKPSEALGQWRVVITTANEDTILAEKEFTVVP
jgi:hypothetical protein